jgi:hypothetical protein
MRISSGSVFILSSFGISITSSGVSVLTSLFFIISGRYVYPPHAQVASEKNIIIDISLLSIILYMKS